MSTVIQSSPVLGAPLGSEAATGSDAATKAVAEAAHALETFSQHLDALYEMGYVVCGLMSDTTDDDGARSVMMGHSALAMEAIEGVHEALEKLRQRGAA